jgi:hypothetical protein
MPDMRVGKAIVRRAAEQGFVGIGLHHGNLHSKEGTGSTSMRVNRVQVSSEPKEAESCYAITSLRLLIQDFVPVKPTT